MTVVSIDLTPAEPVLDGRHLATIVERWLEDCARRLPPVTVTGYATKTRYFVDWWVVVGPAQNYELRQIDLHRFAQSLHTVTAKNGNALGFNTRKDALRRLRSALLWAYRKGYTRHLNVAEWVPDAPDGSAPLHLPLSIESLARLMWTAADLPFSLRNQALLSTFIGTGARLSEVAGLAVGDVTLHADHSGLLRIRSAKKVRGRDIHERIACFDKFAGHYICRWLDLRGTSHGPLWIGVDGRELTGQGIYKAVRTVAQAAGVSFKGMHDFRRTFITHFASKRPGEGYYHLMQMQVGHAPQGTTRRFYDLRSIDELQAAFVSPMEDIVMQQKTLSRT